MIGEQKIDAGFDATHIPADPASVASREAAAAKARHNLSAELMDRTPGARDGDQQAMVAARLLRDELYAMLGLTQPSPEEPTARPVRVDDPLEARVVAAIRPTGDDVDWRPNAACAGVDPELFFPISEHNTRQIAQAKAICATCPVIEQCRGWALGNHQAYGVWGGMSETERRAIQRRSGLRAVA